MRQFLTTRRLFFLFALCACGSDDASSQGPDREPPFPPASGTATTGTEPPITTSSGATAGDAGPGDTSDEGLGFITDFDVGPVCSRIVDGASPDGLFECDPWLQDCPRGQKCAPRAECPERYWDGTTCTDVVDTPDGLGDPCVVEFTATSGRDSCDLGLVCLGAQTGDLSGACFAQCAGNESQPSCPRGTRCAILANGALPICLPRCDPTARTCPRGLRCQQHQQDFVCAPMLEPAGAGAPCSDDYQCADGATCADAAVVPDCGSDRCCTNYCDRTDPNASATCLPGQACRLLDPLPPAFAAHVGICRS